MFLKTLKLKNIRSYVDDVIEFPAGSLLIEGDIGSGKSTILLGIDFALFGARVTELPASSLLRNGANRGEVALTFTLDGKEIEIRRVLEKKGGRIAQTAGHITINGTRKDLMSTGLKSIVFELLGYPLADLKAGKSLIYRYTVYTPQEQMKMILMQKPDERLNTIRSIFNIDKYKRVRENSKTIIREFKKDASRLEGIAYDLKEKEEKRKLFDVEKKNIDDELKKKESVHEKINENLLSKKNEKARLQDVLKTLVLLSTEMTVEKTRLDNDEKALAQLVDEMADAEKKLVRMQAENDFELKIKDLSVVVEGKDVLNEKARKVDDDIRHVEKKITESNTRKNASNDVIKNIADLSLCPTCRQEVPDAHKERIAAEEKKKADNFLKIALIQEKTYDELNNLKKEFRIQTDKVTEDEKMLVRLKAEFQAYNAMKDDVEKKKLKAKELEGSIFGLKKSIDAMQKEIEPLKDAEENSVKLEKELDILNGEFTVSHAQIEKYKQQLSGIDAECLVIDKEIDLKVKAKEESIELSLICDWVKEYFLNLMETMEKHIMLSILRDFDMLFREWFNILIDDDNLQARIDLEFTPVIEQNGYETSYSYLSGGEKTAIALAYRLALNKVINNMSEDIKTRNLLILDEPTDGFSTEQLDKVRDVLMELDLVQTIIVSHEEKIESFVDRTIRIVKKDHVSRVVA